MAVGIPDPGVMDSRLARSAHVNEMLATAAPQAKGRWEELYRSSRDDLYAYVATLLRDPAAAEDVTALSFERAYRRRRSFNARRGNERAWLFGIARNAALDELRRRRRHAALGVEPEDLEAPDPADEADVALRRTTVRAALAELSPRERELIALKFGSAPEKIFRRNDDECSRCVVGVHGEEGWRAARGRYEGPPSRVRPSPDPPRDQADAEQDG